MDHRSQINRSRIKAGQLGCNTAPEGSVPTQLSKRNQMPASSHTAHGRPAGTSLLAGVGVGHEAEGPLLRREVGGLLRVQQAVGGVQDAGPGGVAGVHCAPHSALLR